MSLFADYIEQFRQDVGLTAEDMAKIMGVSEAGFDNFVSDYVPPSQRAMSKLIAALALYPDKNEKFPFETVDLEELRRLEGGFVYEISGDGLSSLGVFPGSMALIKPCPQPKDGDIVLAGANGAEPELMVYSEKGDSVCLSSDRQKIELPRREANIIGRLARLGQRYE